jgi:enediyne biosynthesis protein E4
MGAGIVDLDNDGLPDLFVTTGSVYPEIERRLSNYPFKTPRLIFRNLGGGRFEELIEQAGPGSWRRTRAAAAPSVISITMAI